MKSRIKNYFFGMFIPVILLFFVAFPALAQIDFGTNLRDYPGAEFTMDIFINLIGGLACNFIRFAIIAATIAVVVYGIMFLKSRGNPQEYGGAKKALIWGLVGVLVIFGVSTIILSVSNFVGYGVPGWINYPIFSVVQCG